MAQGNPGPYGKLFGRAPASSAAQDQTRVEVRSSISANYDDALMAPEGSPADTPLQSGASAGGSAVLSLDHRSSGFIASLTGGAGRGQYFTQPSPYGNTQYFANARVVAPLSTRFEADASAGYLHSPTYEFFSEFGRGPTGLENGVRLDSQMPYSPYAAQMLENETIDAAAGLTTRIAKRSSIYLFVSQRQTQFAEQPDDDL